MGSSCDEVCGLGQGLNSCVPQFLVHEMGSEIVPRSWSCCGDQTLECVLTALSTRPHPLLPEELPDPPRQHGPPPPVVGITMTACSVRGTLSFGF